ncbi:isoprenyl transferase [Calidifontibacillus oryziterrae]|uniref:isoprenyl transferase n=1 Tax=Calidifontibacillus oryziterrae TaxID=1191699 RepID=UPI00031E52C4|nr:isoprenyl transferase [Calidifontibacillus oryziterrae]
MLEKFSFRKEKTDSKGSVYSLEQIDRSSVPNHIAIIMDGNGRWAKKRGLPRVAGHHEGMKVVRKIVKASNEVGIRALTLYAFSTENWKRPKTEVDYLMKLPEEFLGTFLPELIEANVQVRVMGNKDQLPPHTRNAITKAISETRTNDGLILNFALNYGSRFEIIEGIKSLLKESNEGKLNIEEINEEVFERFLLSAGLKDPDLLIRTSGEIRLSNFMLWQLAYSELWFTDILWPDFNENHFYQAIVEYQRRTRRFGGV